MNKLREVGANGDVRSLYQHLIGAQSVIEVFGIIVNTSGAQPGPSVQNIMMGEEVSRGEEAP